MSKYFQRFMANMSGQAVAEFALILPVLMLVLFGILKIGLIISSQQIVTYAAREGARAGALSNENEQIFGAVRSAVRYIDPDNERTLVQIIPESEASSDRVRGKPLQVIVSYMVPLHVPLVAQDEVEVRAEATVRIE